jgi:glycosyltransferase involved in cell wall biosynthesis
VKKVVVLGMMAKMPVPGVLWQTVHYLVGLRRLGFDPYYVEAHARTPSMLMERETDDGSGRAASLIADVLGRFDLEDRWAYHALHHDGRCLGMSERRLRRLYGEAEAIVNLHGGTAPWQELADTGRLVYLETDPVRLQIELHAGLQSSIDFLDAHCAHFTFAENLGSDSCSLPVSDRFTFLPTRQPVVLDFWSDREPGAEQLFTTVGNWRQRWRTVQYQGETYGWSKDEEWCKFLDLPARTGRAFELALSGCDPSDEEELARHGWRVRPALDLGLESYRDYIAGSTAEFTVAKDQNVRFATGWFSDRSATYLAAGRPVMTQDTGFGRIFPTGEGLFAVQDVDEAAAAVEAIASDPTRHSRAASEIAREHFDAGRVLGRLLEDVGVRVQRPRPVAAANGRRRLGPDSAVLALIPHFKCEQWLDDCLASLRAQTRPLDGIVVIDDASNDPPIEIVERHPGVTLLHAAENVGPYRLIQQVMEDTDYDAYMFQDADDWSAPERLEKLLEGAESTGAELIGSQEVRVFCDEPEAVPIAWPLDGNAPFEERPTAFSCLHPTSLVSRDLVMAVGGFASGLRFGGDAEFLRRVHWIATVANVSHHGYYRRIRQNSLTTAPATAIGTPVRKQLMEETFARANANAELVAAGKAPDLSPLRTAPPVELRHIAGPALHSTDAVTRRPPRPAPPTPESPAEGAPQPIFVVGADRAGASALACALGEHPAIALSHHGGWLGAVGEQLEAAHTASLEDDPAVFGVDPPTAEAFSAPLAETLARLAGGSARHFVDAAWQHTRDVRRLIELYPDARFIHIARDVHSAVRALADPPLGSPGATGGTQVPARLRAKVSEPEAVERWVEAVDRCLDAEASVPDGRFLTVSYDELLAKPGAVVARCLEFVGEPPAEQCLRPLRELRTLVEDSRLEPDVDPHLWSQALALSRDLCGIGKAARIVMVTDHFPKVSETFFVDKLLGLLRRGWDVHVVSQRSNKEHWEYFPTLREELGDTERLHVARDDIDGKLAELKPDLVHFGYGVLAAGRMHLRESLGCKIVVSFRGFDLNTFRVDDPTAYDDVWRSADLLHVVSEDIWRRAKERGCPPDRTYALITDAVDVNRLEAPNRPLERVGTAERPLRLLSVGRLHWKKGHDHALAAVRMLLDRGVEVSYRIVGDGEHREPTQFAVRDLGLEGHVELVGALPAPEVRDQFAWADVLVHPSVTEAFGVAVAEAQAMGLPVVCSDAGGLPENVQDGVTGFVVSRRDPGAVAYAIDRLVDDPSLRQRMGWAARERAVTLLSLDRQLDAFESVYQHVLSQPGPPHQLSMRAARVEGRRRDLDALREELASGEARDRVDEAVWRREVVERVHAFVEAELPAESRVLVVSRGDESIVDFGRHRGEHFPQAERGVYAGHHPADSADAIARLEALRSGGADYLVIPATSGWWLDHYDELARHLDSSYARVGADDGAFVAYCLSTSSEAVA